jgi:ribonucleotide monophosphatase NagD (HAD superfamily)
MTELKVKTFCFDIDGVIMTLTPGNDYTLAKPIVTTVELINRLHDHGHRIILFTARGYVTGIDWQEITARQMRDAGVKYHELKFGKPAADYYIDDKMIGLAELADLLEKQTI